MEKFDVTKEVSENLRLLYREGDVIELRIFGLPGRGTVSGYYDDFDKIAKIAALHDGKSAIYHVLNPVPPELKARADNEPVSWAKHTTTDKDILQRRYIFIDCDPVRPTDASSTKQEHNAAREKSKDIMAWLMNEQGFPGLFWADSGNGYHILVPIDLPNNNETTKLLKSFIMAIKDKFEDDKVIIDTSVTNAARLIRVWGTKNVKGENTDERPHRNSRLLDVPASSTLQIATREDIARVAELYKKPAKAVPKLPSSNVTDIPAFIKQNGILVEDEEEKDGSTFYHLKECVFNPEHKYKDAAIIVSKEGHVAYYCFHDSCSEKTFKDVLLKYEHKDYILFRDQYKEALVQFWVNDHFEIHRLHSRHFKAWLANLMDDGSGEAPNGRSIDDALRLYEYDCLFGPEEHELFVRVAPLGDNIWIDLADPLCRAIEVTKQGWQITEPPILFYRHATTGRQVEPIRGGSLELLRPFLNVASEDAWILIQVWIIAAFIPTIAHPILVIYGEQGTAKTTHMVLLSKLIDPSMVSVGTEPEQKPDWIQAADHRYCVTLDNVTHLPQWLSDCLCRAVTGESFTKRRLYTDSDDVLFSFRRVIALTGIQQVAQKPDLLDRAILHGLEPIPPSSRKLEAEVMLEFEEVRPAIFGAVLDILSQVLAELPNVRLKNYPRMADFARIGVAVQRVLGWDKGTFMNAYNRNIKSQHEEAIEASSVAQALRLFLMDQSSWEGTAAQLLDCLTDVACRDGRLPNDWPKSPRAFGGKLRENTPNLRHFGVSIIFRSSNGRRLVSLSKQD